MNDGLHWFFGRVWQGGVLASGARSRSPWRERNPVVLGWRGRGRGWKREVLYVHTYFTLYYSHWCKKILGYLHRMLGGLCGEQSFSGICVGCLPRLPSLVCTISYCGLATWSESLMPASAGSVLVKVRRGHHGSLSRTVMAAALSPLCRNR